MPSSPLCEDGVGDVADADRSLPEVKVPGTDLTGVVLALDADRIRITFTATERIPIDAGPSDLGDEASILWYVLTNSDEGGSYLLQAELIGTHWYTDAFDLEQRAAGAERGLPRSQRFEKPVISEKTVSVTFPLTELPTFAVPLTWSAGTEWGDFDIYGDACPDNGRMRFDGTDSSHSGPNPS